MPVLSSLSVLSPLSVLSVCVVCALRGPGAIEAPPPLAVLPLTVAVARVDGAPVVDRVWIDDRVEQANAILAPTGVQVALAEVRAMPEGPAALEDRKDRDALGAHLRPRRVNIFVVASLRDVDEPERLRQGVHWRPRRARQRHLVIVAAYSGRDTLAHELGHFLGNPRHSHTPGNLMSYGRGPGLPTLDAAQVRTIRATARRMLRSRELVVAPPVSP